MATDTGSERREAGADASEPPDARADGALVDGALVDARPPSAPPPRGAMLTSGGARVSSARYRGAVHVAGPIPSGTAASARYRVRFGAIGGE